MKTISVIGSGVMGHGIAQIFALKGHQVFLYDLNEGLLKKAFSQIDQNLSLLVKEAVLQEEKKAETLSRISLCTSLKECVETADFIIEAIPEILELKWSIYQELDELAPANAIIASNTSTFPLSKLTEKSQRPERMIITHFFNPAQTVPLVEIVKGESANSNTVKETIELMKKIGKVPVELKKETPGFIANRLQAALMREAFHLLAEGVASAEEIDKAVTAGPGFRWSVSGPFEIADFGGLDTWKRVLDQLSPELSTEESAPDLINIHVQKNQLGAKTGSGIYSYTEDNLSKKHQERERKLLKQALHTEWME
ncbi:3-hydroxyacyl-CoA dehydrogenase family protein [Heyndrickxia acidicola]|uniref:L-gulonate 3-dehydrogenase n=1 Tax=Heyndrickxia acidicola TaxID=209389 RepID=A0ABU6MIT5_9BACI|nr:3-hydroxyacyl-CoA dehydrogenase family protein [Heyndrickxia acidicola]MED1204440.1 3-hydroxyacyl-CoA dehydrogenase family protein [Heyndrickxia acidicola]